MPTTVNGIGTHYYGRREASARLGTCQHCGASGHLESYNTRLWFVIIFIPIIPLKRVRILDCCPRCSRHWVANPEQYEMSRQLAVSGALEKHRALPSVETAMVAHAQFLSFHMHTEADAFRQAALSQFKDNVDLLTGFAAHLDQTGRWTEATPLYQQAFTLQPTLPEVRYSLGWRRTNENRLDEAFELFDYLRQPGAGQTYNLEQLVVLARAYQKEGNHETALELCAICLRELPQVGGQYAFREVVKKSERALGLKSSLLPPKSFSLRGLVDSRSGTHAPWVRWATFGSIAALLFVGGMSGMNEYFRSYRTLHVVNGFAQPVQVSVDGGPPVTVAERTRFELSEGTHQLTVSGPVTKQQQFELRTGYWSRWTNTPTWVFNIEKLAAVHAHTIYYAIAPAPPESHWLGENELSFIPHVDYEFTDPPHELRLEGRNSTVTKVHVELTPIPPATIYYGLKYATNQHDQEVALTFAEGHLARNPNDDSLLLLYATNLKGEANELRVLKFLKAGLWRQPISVRWHRAYQHQKSVAADEAALADEYNTQLTQAPNDAALLYLRGLVGATRAEKLQFFRLAGEQDPQSSWPTMALAYDAANRGEWREAQVWCDKVATTFHADQSFRQLRHVVKMANGDLGPLEQEYRQQLQGQDLVPMLQAAFRLADILAAQGQYDKARQSIGQWWSTMMRHSPSADGFSACDLMLDYVTGNTESFLKGRAKYNSQTLPQFQFQFLLAAAEPEAAEKIESFDEITKEWSELLALSLSYSLAGNQAEADAWLGKACDAMRKGGRDAQLAAAWLQGDHSPTTDDLDEIKLNISDTPLLLTVLARRFPDSKREFNQRAERLNISRHPPYLLVKNAIERP